MVRAEAVRWYGNVLQRDKGDILKEALNFKVTEKRGRPKATWKKHVETLIEEIGLRENGD